MAVFCRLTMNLGYNKRAWYRPKSKTSTRRIDLGPKMVKLKFNS